MLTMFPNGLRLMGNNGCLEYLAQGPSKICKKTFQERKTDKYFDLGITGLNRISGARTSKDVQRDVAKVQNYQIF